MSCSRWSNRRAPADAVLFETKFGNRQGCRQGCDSNPDAVIDFVLEVLKIEDNDAVLGLLAAGPLENAISMTTIERIEREAAAHDKFRWLLGGVWYSSAPEPLKARLDAIVQDQRW